MIQVQAEIHARDQADQAAVQDRVELDADGDGYCAACRSTTVVHWRGGNGTHHVAGR